MKNLTNLLIPVAFLVLMGFSLNNGDYLEATLYLFVGGGFTMINMIKSKAITKNLGFWNKFSWGLVILSMILFMALLFDDANKEMLNL